MYPKSNPSVLSRFASTNAAFKNANGILSCFIHPKCQKLRSDLQARTYKPGTRIPADETGTDIGHITDALGYAIHKLRPMSQAFQPAPIAATGG
jgi:hypothetical protein